MTVHRGSKFKVIIFDLDDTLLDTHGQITEHAIREAFLTMIAAGLNATLDECLSLRKQLLQKISTRLLFSAIAEKKGTLPTAAPTDSVDSIAAIGLRAYYHRTTKEHIQIPLDTYRILEELKLNHSLFLVTAGNPQGQQSKVQRLRLAPHFDGVFYTDPEKGETKRSVFLQILNTLHCNPQEVLCVGNRQDVEIAQAKDLGISTCLLLTSEYAFAQASREEEVPDYEIDALQGLVDICLL